ncbi:MAG: hypothetical protein AAF699_19735 [Pseudomonadota bacterium]
MIRTQQIRGTSVFSLLLYQLAVWLRRRIPLNSHRESGYRVACFGPVHHQTVVCLTGVAVGRIERDVTPVSLDLRELFSEADGSLVVYIMRSAFGSRKVTSRQPRAFDAVFT